MPPGFDLNSQCSGQMAQVHNCPDASDILSNHGVAIVPANQQPRAGETRAVGTLQQIVAARGKDHAEFVVMTLTEAGNGRACLNKSMFWAVSDLVLAAERNYPEIMRNDVEKWFSLFDALALGWLQSYAADLDGIVPKRHALVGMIWERLTRIWDNQPALCNDRKTLS